MAFNVKYVKRVPYFFTPFLIIPIVGGIFGIFFVLFYIFLYRDKFIIICGCIGIVISLIYGTFFGFNLKNGEKMQQAVTVLSIKEMDEISGYLEIYKKKYGEYPDSLIELKNLNPKIDLFDPVLNLKTGKLTQFNYELIPGGYKLYSSGLDTISGTEDDLFSNFK